MVEEKENENPQCVKGIHWGKYEIGEKAFEFNYENKQIMNIPYTKILNSYCIKNVKTEINLELNIDEEDGM